jgi:hypothetical protein
LDTENTESEEITEKKGEARIEAPRLLPILMSALLSSKPPLLLP